MTQTQLQAEIRQRLPSELWGKVTQLASGHLNVRIEDRAGIGAYNLTITEASQPISAENIVNNARHLLAAGG